MPNSVKQEEDYAQCGNQRCLFLKTQSINLQQVTVSISVFLGALLVGCWEGYQSL